MILKEATIREIKTRMERYPSHRSAVLPALTAAYKQVGYLTPAIYRELARVIKVPYVEIMEAATFYTMFPKQEVGRYLIQVCHNISCSLRGADNMITYIESKLDIKLGETTPDNMFTLISVECLGGCSAGPMFQIDDTYYEDLTREKIDKILTDLRAQAEQDSR
ncbi:MAG: NAD(P)H-dependent oxidoreductase subunit E [FCB group bacterium]|nr:NAD(P)H-dependent oxidoreductase subunit E [FCB group bacterium]